MASVSVVQRPLPPSVAAPPEWVSPDATVAYGEYADAQAYYRLADGEVALADPDRAYEYGGGNYAHDAGFSLISESPGSNGEVVLLFSDGAVSALPQAPVSGKNAFAPYASGLSADGILALTTGEGGAEVYTRDAGDGYYYSPAGSLYDTSGESYSVSFVTYGATTVVLPGHLREGEEIAGCSVVADTLSPLAGIRDPSDVTGAFSKDTLQCARLVEDAQAPNGLLVLCARAPGGVMAPAASVQLPTDAAHLQFVAFTDDGAHLFLLHAEEDGTQRVSYLSATDLSQEATATLDDLHVSAVFVGQGNSMHAACTAAAGEGSAEYSVRTFSLSGATAPAFWTTFAGAYETP